MKIPAIDQKEKTCTRCKEIKPTDSFYAQSQKSPNKEKI